MLMYIHTRKAVKRGEPADRLFLVSYAGRDGNLIAWKCIITPAGVVHPAYKAPLKIDRLEKAGELVRGRNGSQPTAVFKPDSLYQKIGPAELEVLIAAAKTANGGKKQSKMKATGSMTGVHAEYGGSMDWLNFSGRMEVKYGKLSRAQSEGAAKLFNKFLADLNAL
jgi:hypothetical protein